MATPYWLSCACVSCLVFKTAFYFGFILILILDKRFHQESRHIVLKARCAVYDSLRAALRAVARCIAPAGAYHAGSDAPPAL